MSGAGPTAVTDQTGQSLRIVQWVRDAWTAIQNEHNSQQVEQPHWKFLWTEWTQDVPTLSGGLFGRDVTLSGIQTPIPESMECYRKASGVSERYDLTFMNWRDNESFWRHDRTDPGPPEFWTLLPSGVLRLMPTPDELYTLKGEGYQAAQVLTNNTDTPLLPGGDSEHMVIVYRAMMDYARFEAASEVIQIAPRQYDNLMTMLQWKYLDQGQDLVSVPQ